MHQSGIESASLRLRCLIFAARSEANQYRKKKVAKGIARQHEDLQNLLGSTGITADLYGTKNYTEAQG